MRDFKKGWIKVATIDEDNAGRFYECNMSFDMDNYACISYLREESSSSELRYARYNRIAGLQVQVVASYTNGFAVSPSLVLYQNKRPGIAYMQQDNGSNVCKVFFTYLQTAIWNKEQVDAITDPASRVCSLAFDRSHPVIVYSKPPIAIGDVVRAVGPSWNKTTIFSKPELHNINTFAICSIHPSQGITYSIQQPGSAPGHTLWFAHNH